MLPLYVSVQCSFHEQPTAADLAAIGEIGWTHAFFIACFACLSCVGSTSSLAVDLAAISEIR